MTFTFCTVGDPGRYAINLFHAPVSSSGPRCIEVAVCHQVCRLLWTFYVLFSHLTIVFRMSAADGFVPDMGRRGLMNGLLLGSIAGPVLVLPAVLISYLVPAKAGGGGGGTSRFVSILK